MMIIRPQKAEDITTTLLARCITPLSITQLVEQTGLENKW